MSKLKYSDFKLGDRVREIPRDLLEGEVIGFEEGIPIIRWQNNRSTFDSLLVRPQGVEIIEKERIY